MARRPVYLALLAAVVAWMTLFSTVMAGPFTPVIVAQDMACETMRAVMQGGATVGRANTGIVWDRKLAMANGADPCASDSRQRLLRFVSVTTYGTAQDYVRLSLALVAAGNLGTIFFPRLSWIWATGLALLYITAWGTTFQLGFYLSVGVVILTLFHVA